MHSFTSTVAFLSVAALVSAQGRYACSRADPTTGQPVPFPDMCTNPVADAAPYPTPNGGVNSNPNTGGFINNQFGYKQNGATPVGSACIEDFNTGNYYCGYQNAACSGDAACDNGRCIGGFCEGGLGMTCNGDDSQCLGKLYCNDPTGAETDSDVCGGLSGNSATSSMGAYCDDGTVAHSETNSFCVTGFCDANTSACGVAVAASQRARSRRSEIATRGARCPASHTACAVTGAARGFECVDVTSNLEQCGACASEGGVDCTALQGVDAVGCVAGKCEIWACAEGFAWDASSASCTVALTM